MKFISGTSSIPPLGLPSKLTINFKHWCRALPKECKCKPTVSTCALSLTLPVHNQTMEVMKRSLCDAVKMSQGFDM